jgi:hypothetical protein
VIGRLSRFAFQAARGPREGLRGSVLALTRRRSQLHALVCVSLLRPCHRATSEEDASISERPLSSFATPRTNCSKAPGLLDQAVQIAGA